MLKIKFKYKDAYTNDGWNEQECIVESIKECKDIYGLNEPDVEYQIISVDEV